MFSIHFHPLLSKVSKLEMEWVLELVQNSQSIVRITISALAFTPATHVTQGCKSWAEIHCGQIDLMLLNRPDTCVSLCTIPCVQPISSQFFTSYPCLTSPLVWLHCPEGVSARSSPLCLNLVFPPTSTLIASFHSFSLIFPYRFFSFSPSPLPLPGPLSLYSSSSSAIMTSLHPSPHSVFSLFYSIVFPSTESSHVQGPDAAGCHHGVEVPIQFASDACGGQHVAPSYDTCCGHCHLQPCICREPMAQHCWWVELNTRGRWYVQTYTCALIKKNKKQKKLCHATCDTYHSSGPVKSLHHRHTQACPPRIIEL